VPSWSAIAHYQVWNASGTLLGKYFIGSTSANFVFANKKLVILAETAVYVAE